jgi:hypothetical protein
MPRHRYAAWRRAGPEDTREVTDIRFGPDLASIVRDQAPAT